MIDVFTRVGAQPEDDRPLDAPALLQALDEAVIAEALCTHFAAIRYDMVAGNSAMLELCRRTPRLHPVASINPGPYIGVAQEVARCAAAGCVGFRLTPALQGWSLEGEPFFYALEAIEATGLPVTIELPGAGDASRLSDIAEEYSAPLILANVTYVTLGEAIVVLEHHEHLLLEASRLATPGSVELLVAHVGAQRLMFGSGAPTWEITPTLRMIQEAEISDEDKHAILEGNARRIYRLG